MKFYIYFYSIIILLLIFTGCEDSTELRYVPVPRYKEDIEKERIVIQSGHKDGITSMTFSPDGKYFASGSYDKSIKLWNRQGMLIKTFIRDPFSITALAFSPDSKTIAAGSDNAIELWSIQGKLITSFKAHSNYISSLVFSPDGKYLISGSWDKSIKLWDIEGRLQLKQTYTSHTKLINACAINPEGTMIISASDDGSLKLWDLSGNELQTIQNKNFGELKTVAFDTVHTHLATGTDDGKIFILSLSGKIIRSIQAHSDIVGHVQFIDNSGKILSSSWDGTIKIWDLEGNLIKTYDMGHNYFEHVAINQDESLLASGSNEHTINVMDMKTDTVTKIDDRIISLFSTVLSNNNSYILNVAEKKGIQSWQIKNPHQISYPIQDSDYYRIAMSPDGRYIAAIFVDKTIKLWDYKGNLLKTFAGHTIEKAMLSFSSNSKFIILNSVKFGSKFWNIESGVETIVKGGSQLYNMIMISPDSNYYCTSGDNKLRVWTIDGKEVLDLEGHSDIISVAAFSADSKYILTGSSDETVKLWDIKGKLIKTMYKISKGVSYIEFSPDGKHFIVQDHESIIKIFTKKGFPVCEFEKGHFVPYIRAAFHPNGKHILLKVKKGFALYSVKGELIKAFIDHPYTANTVGFSHDGHYILAVFLDGVVKICDTNNLKSINLVSFSTGDWLVYDDSNHFECSDKGEGLVAFMKGLELIPIEHMRDTLYTDGLLQDFFKD